MLGGSVYACIYVYICTFPMYSTMYIIWYLFQRYIEYITVFFELILYRHIYCT